MKRFSWMFLLALTAVSAHWAMAQDAATTTAAPAAAPDNSQAALPAGVPGPRVKLVNHRLMEQAARVKEGVKSGVLTKETAKPFWEEIKAIRAQEKTDMEQNGKRGLTDDQFNALTLLLDDNSKSIYAAKHGGSAPAAAASTDTASAPSTDTSADPDSDSSN
jgi:hypothetical protein